MAVLKITQIKSAVSRKQDQGRTLKALGLRRIRDSVEHEDRPEILGMIRKVEHLVTVEQLKGSRQSQTAAPAEAPPVQEAPAADSPVTPPTENEVGQS
jgi:large subunit ribosomal protein L30